MERVERTIRREDCREEEVTWGREKVRIFSVSLHPELICKLFSSQWQKGEPASASWQDSGGFYLITARSLVAGEASGQIEIEYLGSRTQSKKTKPYH